MKVITAILSCVAISVAAAESRHPCVYFRADELPSLREKAKDVAWAREIVARWHREVDSAVLRHADDPSFAPSRLQMNWTEGKRYTKAWTQDNFIPRREGNAKYPTIRIAYARTWGTCPSSKNPQGDFDQSTMESLKLKSRGLPKILMSDSSSSDANSSWK